jgi:hypothetical protein
MSRRSRSHSEDLTALPAGLTLDATLPFEKEPRRERRCSTSLRLPPCCGFPSDSLKATNTIRSILHRVVDHATALLLCAPQLTIVVSNAANCAISGRTASRAEIARGPAQAKPRNHCDNSDSSAPFCTHATGSRRRDELTGRTSQFGSVVPSKQSSRWLER